MFRFLKYIFFIFTAINFAQSYKYTKYDINSGLPSAKVYDILQDNTGYLWVSTGAGVTKYDGRRFLKIEHSPVKEFTKLDLTSDGTVWGIERNTYFNVVKLNESNYYNYRLEEFNKLDLIINGFKVLKSGENYIWVIGGNFPGIYIYDKGWHYFTKAGGKKIGEIKSVVKTENRFYFSDKKRIYEYSVFSGLKVINESIKGIRELHYERGELFYLTRNTLGKVNGRENIILYSQNFNSILSYTELYEPVGFYYDTFLFAVYNNLYFLKPDGNVIKVEYGNLIKEYVPYKFLIDKENIIWIAGRRGLYKIENFIFENYNNSNGLLDDEVTSVEPIKDGISFAHNFGFTLLQKGKLKRIKLNLESYENSRILDQHYDKSTKTLWFAGDWIGFGKLKNGKVTIVKNGGKIRAQSIIVEGNNGWAISSNKLFRIENGKFYEVEEFKIFEHDYFRKLFLDEDGSVWIVTNNHKLINYKEGKITLYESDALTGTYGFCRYNNEILLGTEIGVTVLKDSTFFPKKFRGKDIQNSVYFIHNVNDTLWLGTDDGIYIIEKDNLIHLSYDDGLAGNETNRDAFYAKGNKVYIGTEKGLSVFSKNLFYVNNSKPFVSVENIQVNEKVYTPDKDLELPYDDNNIEFDILPVSFLGNNAVSVYCRLKGYEENWNELKDKFSYNIRYTNLSSGTYQLEVKAKNKFEVYSDVISTNNIKIGVPFYLTPVFLFFVAIIVIAIINFIVRYNSNKLYASRLEKDIRARTEELFASKERYKLLISNIQDGLVVITGGSVAYYNTKADKILNEPELNGKEFANLISVKSLEEFNNLCNYVLSKELTVKEKKIELYNGQIIVLSASSIDYEGHKSVMLTFKDITEELKKELDFKKFNTVVEQSPLSIIITDLKGNIEYVNSVFEGLTQYSKEELIGKNMSILKSNKTDRNFYNELWSTINKGFTWSGELINKKKNGALFVARVTIYPLKDKDSKIINFIAFEEDITKERKAIEKIKTNEQLLTTVLNNLPILLFAINREGILTLCRGKGMEIFNINLNDIIGLKAKDLFVKYDEIIADIDRALTGEDFSNIYKIRDNVFETFFAPIYSADGSLEGSLAVSLDITERYLNDIAIKNSEATNRAIVNAMPDLLFELDSNGNYLKCYNPDKGVFNKRKINFIGKNIKEVLEDIYAYRALKCIKDAIETNEVVMIEYPLKIGDKTEYFESRVIAISQEKVLSVVRNVTAKIELEESLIREKELAVKSDKLKSEFLAQMSHEIRTPINSILSFTSLIKEEVKDYLNEDLMISFSAIEKGSRRLIRTIDLILNMSQMQTGTYEPVYDSINLRKDILEPVVKDLKSQAIEKNLKLLLKYESEVEYIVADNYTLGQIYINLIGNAIKYTEQGEITVKVSDNGKQLITEVCDTGIGISEEYLPNLFKPFTQEESGYTRKYEGNGLGLALVKKYVELNKANISVKSKKNEGTTFIVTFNILD